VGIAHPTKSHKLSACRAYWRQLLRSKTIALNRIHSLTKNFPIKKFLFLENFKIIHVVDKPQNRLDEFESQILSEAESVCCGCP